MSPKESPQSVIDSYRKRQQLMPILIGGLALALVIVGIVILVIWISGPNAPSLFPSATPTATNTLPPTPIPPTPTNTLPPTEAPTQPPSQTNTPSGPMEYTVKEGDFCSTIADDFKVDLLVLIALNDLGSNCGIQVGQKILIPLPGQVLPTETPMPPNTPKGTKVNYTVKSGDTIGKIAEKFNSTSDSILKDNKITNANNIFVGQILIVSVNIVTPVPTKAPTIPPALVTPEPTRTLVPLIFPTVGVPTATKAAQ
ncbi:MAG: LysM peptidoglycan-binding domain-containing protein [Anaerolineaceae bacterium]